MRRSPRQSPSTVIVVWFYFVWSPWAISSESSCCLVHRCDCSRGDGMDMLVRLHGTRCVQPQTRVLAVVYILAHSSISLAFYLSFELTPATKTCSISASPSLSPARASNLDARGCFF